MYCTAAEVVAYAGIESPTVDDTTLLDSFIAAAQKFIDNHCGQSFEAATDSTRYFCATSVDNGGAVDGRDLILDRPLAAITSVTNGDGVVVAAGSYITQPRNDTPYYAIRLKSSSAVSWTYDDDPDEDAIAVVGKWAYSVEAPADIVLATKMLVAYAWRQKDNTGDQDRAVLIGNSVSLPAQIPKDVLEILSAYMRKV